MSSFSFATSTMQRRRLVLGAAAVVIAIAWYAFRPERLVIDRTVNERLPVASDTLTPLFSGVFHGVAHESHGTATVLGAPSGARVLRFTEFETSNGPDVRVYLVAAADARDDETVRAAGFVELGVLKGNKGDQNYE